MFKSFSLLAMSVICLAACGQSFECYPVGPLPIDPSMGCEGVDSNGLGFGTGVTNVLSCGFPTAGLNYVQMDANGPVPVPPGGPFPWPVPASPAPCEVRVSIPTGASVISFDWEYFNAEGVGSFYNDGFAVAVVTSTGALLQQLVYVDNQVPLGTCFNAAASGTEVAPSGFQSFVGALPGLSPCAYVSFVCWNNGDNAVPGHAYIDNIVFNSAVAGCAVPCFGSPPPALSFSSPGGMGCLMVTMSGLPSSGQYFFPVTLNPGAFPNGWLFGIDVGFPELASEINSGYPFSGPVTAGSCSSGGATIGPFCGLPSGLTLYAVALGIPLGASYPTTHTPAVSYTIP